jgi:simple sugar transport system ATP-binding protein
MFDGRISGERAAGETDERELGLLMAGVEPGTKAA